MYVYICTSCRTPSASIPLHSAMIVDRMVYNRSWWSTFWILCKRNRVPCAHTIHFWLNSEPQHCRVISFDTRWGVLIGKTVYLKVTFCTYIYSPNINSTYHVFIATFSWYEKNVSTRVHNTGKMTKWICEVDLMKLRKLLAPCLHKQSLYYTQCDVYGSV